MNRSFLLFVLCLSQIIFGQADSTRVEQLEEVTINASRIQSSTLKFSRAVTVLSFEKTQQIRQQLSLQDYLQNSPGVFAMNAHNFSQDLRVSIRGFGARAAFGIRGLKLLVDGIPETTPDGQGQVDNLNLGLIKSIEILKGPSATLYGNASGGVISISTTDVFNKDYVKGGLTFGSNNMQQYQISAGMSKEKSTIAVHVARTETSGYREQSGFENNNFQLRYHNDLTNRSKLTLRLNYNNSPIAEDAGGLTLEEVKENRKQVRTRNAEFKTGEEIEQFKSGFNYSYNWKTHKFNTYGFFATRVFEGLLPFEYGGWVDLDRKYLGIGSNVTFELSKKKTSNKLMFGYDWAHQNDDRKRFFNSNGEQGNLTLDQLEKFNSFGLYALSHLEFGKLGIQAGLRYDINKLKAEDTFLINGDQSGEIDLDALNPSIGFSLQITPRSLLYSNISTSFETPVLSELSANPSGLGGFNEDLDAQEAANFELGYRYNASKIVGDITLFAIRTTDEFVPFELEAYPDRTFYKNAGKTQRYGIELSSRIDLFEKLQMQLSYAYSDFTYDDFVVNENDFSDKRLPGIPKHKGSMNLNYTDSRGLRILLSNQIIGKLYANNSNSVADDAYYICSLNAGYALRLHNWTLTPFFGINNLFDTEYNDNIRINAFGKRYYEPAPGIQVFGGVRFNIGE